MFSEMEQHITRSVLRSQQSSVTGEIDFSFPFRRGVGVFTCAGTFPLTFKGCTFLHTSLEEQLKSKKKKK